ncbi:MAG: recombinase family protein [Nitrospiraceae bacterium]
MPYSAGGRTGRTAVQVLGDQRLEITALASNAVLRHVHDSGVQLRSATEPIDDTSTRKLMEGVLAAFAQFDKDVRSDRTRAGMRAALELGRWTFLAPIGYLNRSSPVRH